MACNNQSGPGPGMPMAQPAMVQGPGPVMTGGSMDRLRDRFPVGMGYVPMQMWETPYPADHALMRGTIFSSLDYPFVVGGCR